MTSSTTEPWAPVPHPATTRCWGDDADVGTLECVGVRQVTHDVKTFVLAAADGAAFHFDPGQFITLHVDLEGRRVERSYTVSSPPTRPYRISITVKRKPGGLVSTWLHEQVGIGTRLRAAPPLGAFSMLRHPAWKYLFLSAGSGVTPMMSMARTLMDLGSDVDVVFVHSARTPADIIFRPEMTGLPTQSPAIDVVQVCTTDSADERWWGRRGHLDAAMLRDLAPDLHEREVFVCGPDGYMATVRAALEQEGYDMAHHHEESYDFASLVPAQLVDPTGDVADFEPPSGEGEQAAPAFAVTFARSGRTVPCGPDEYVLDAAFAAGMSLPSSCSQGMCGTCKAVLLAGEVDMRHNGGIRPREVAAGKVLLCCSRPLGDLTVDG